MTAKRLKVLPEKYEPGFLRLMDKRTEVAQRLLATFNGVVADRGGLRCLSFVQLGVIERYCFLALTLERLEHKIAINPKVDADIVARWVQASNAFMGAAKTIGLDKRDSGAPSFTAYIAERA